MTRRGDRIQLSPIDFEWAQERTWGAVRTKGHVYAAYSSQTKEDGYKSVYMHREIMKRSGFDVLGKQIDHKNRDTLDNRRENLRFCTHAQNVANSYRRTEGRACPYKGVDFVRLSKVNPWAARIRVGGKNIHLGVFRTMEDAALCYDLAAVEHFGEFAALNFTNKPLVSMPESGPAIAT